MSYPSMALNYWKWLLLCLTPGLFFLSWVTFVKPHAIKNLQTEATQTADRIIDAFSVRTNEDLSSIAQVFLHVEDEQGQASSLFIDDLNTQFKRIHGFESFTLPPSENKGELVLFNPYVAHSRRVMTKEACTEALTQYPERLKTYDKLTFLPLDDVLCVYSPMLHMFAVLNLKTTLDEQLTQERRKGYFLALLEDQLPELIPSNWHFSWIHSRFFSFLGTEWKIHVYPSRAYIEASIRRVFRVFFITILGCLGFFGWWSLRRGVSSAALDPDYVAHLRQMALFDGVTNLPNRRHFMSHLDTILKRALRHHTSFSVCFMDCDGFKKINDDYGHHIGDQVLRHIADEVSAVVRKNDFFARFSGDEFCLILEGTTSEGTLKVTLDKILSAISLPFFTGETTISVTMSIGVAVYPKDGTSADVLLKHADEAMYVAKRRQKNTYFIYQS